MNGQYIRINNLAKNPYFLPNPILIVLNDPHYLVLPQLFALLKPVWNGVLVKEVGLEYP